MPQILPLPPILFYLVYDCLSVWIKLEERHRESWAPVNKPETSDSILRGRKLNPGFREQAAINCAAVTLLYPRHLLKSVANKELGINKSLGEKRNSLYDDSPAAAWVSRRTSCLLKRRGTCRFNRGENIR